MPRFFERILLRISRVVGLIDCERKYFHDDFVGIYGRFLGYNQRGGETRFFFFIFYASTVIGIIVDEFLN